MEFPVFKENRGIMIQAPEIMGHRMRLVPQEVVLVAAQAAAAMMTAFRLLPEFWAV
jgi:hypothetical protein